MPGGILYIDINTCVNENSIKNDHHFNIYLRKIANTAPVRA